MNRSDPNLASYSSLLLTSAAWNLCALNPYRFCKQQRSSGELDLMPEHIIVASETHWRKYMISNLLLRSGHHQHPWCIHSAEHLCCTKVVWKRKKLEQMFRVLKNGIICLQHMKVYICDQWLDPDNILTWLAMTHVLEKPQMFSKVADL